MVSSLRISDIILQAADLKASDIHLTVGMPPCFRINGMLIPIGSPEIGSRIEAERRTIGPLKPEDTTALLHEIASAERFEKFQKRGDIDFTYSEPGGFRVRVNAFKQRGSIAIAMRLLGSKILSFGELGLPDVLNDLSRRSHGLVVVTGPTGSGKSTTLAAMLDLMNRERQLHIITLEDPIEYLHRHNQCAINQREIGGDTLSFSDGLRSALRENPDVIMVGEMRDLETISTALTAAETGHLVLATLHTSGAPETINRMIDPFPPHQQQQIRTQIYNTLEGIVSQLLLPRADGLGMVLACEVMVTTAAIKNQIREGKTHQILSQMQVGSKHGMVLLDTSLRGLYQRGLIDKREALNHARDPENLELAERAPWPGLPAG
jgi:twitching motility protein PilT